MKKTKEIIEVSKLLLNEGQLEWLPKNPRQWTQTDLDRTKVSLEEDPDFLEDRPLLVTPFEDKYIVFGGNLRTTALRELNMDTAPSVLYIPETEDDYMTIIRRAMKDNGSFGSWDFDVLANEWDKFDLQEWGVPAWGVMGDGDLDGLFEEAGEKDKDNTIRLTIEIPEGYADKVEDIKSSITLTLEEWTGCKVK